MFYPHHYIYMLYSFGTTDVDKAMFKAIEAEDSKSLKYLLEHGADVNAKDHRGCNPIDNSISKCNKDMVELLVTKGADVEAKDSNCNRGHFMVASWCNEPLEIMKILVKSSKDTEAELRALCHAAFQGKTKTADFFIKTVVNVNKLYHGYEAPLHWAVASKDVKVVELLLNNGADVNAKNHEGLTPLMEAALNHPSLEIIKSLVEHGADVDAKDSNGMSPLLYASYRDYRGNRSEFIKYLVENGADVNSQNHRGKSTLLSVVKNSNCMDDTTPELVSFLLEHGADMDAKDSDGMSPLFWAGHFRHKEIVRSFVNYDLAKNDNYLSFGADDVKKEEFIDFLCHTSLMERYGGELLHAAVCCNCSLERVKFLIYHGADIQFTNNYFDNRTVLHEIVTHSWYSKYLRSREDNPKDTSPQFREEYSNAIELLKFLLGHGIDPNAKNTVGKTAAEYIKVDEVSEILYYYTEEYNLHPFCNFSDCQKVCPVY